jgi:adenylate kinase
MVAPESGSLQERRVAVRTWLGTGSINVLGMQFAGKDTHCRRLAAWMSGVVLGGGDISRNQSLLSSRARKITEAGALIPTDEFLKMAVPFLTKTEYMHKPLLLSAVGRWHGEEPGVIEALERADHPLRAAVLLEIDEDEAWRRWGLMHEVKDRGHRVDDSEEGLRMRLQEFRNKTLPVIDFYKGRGLLISVDGSRSPDEVELAILDGLHERATRAS